jgi:hypothetical protein
LGERFDFHKELGLVKGVGVVEEIAQEAAEELGVVFRSKGEAEDVDWIRVFGWHEPIKVAGMESHQRGD